jgi:hypothetical protein
MVLRGLFAVERGEILGSIRLLVRSITRARNASSPVRRIPRRVVGCRFESVAPRTCWPLLAVGCRAPTATARSARAAVSDSRLPDPGASTEGNRRCPVPPLLRGASPAPRRPLYGLPRAGPYPVEVMMTRAPTHALLRPFGGVRGLAGRGECREASQIPGWPRNPRVNFAASPTNRGLPASNWVRTGTSTGHGSSVVAVNRRHGARGARSVAAGLRSHGAAVGVGSQVPLAATPAVPSMPRGASARLRGEAQRVASCDAGHDRIGWAS